VVTEALYELLAPGGYADEHVAHYTRQELIDTFAARGFVLEATRYILRGELILAFRKPERPACVLAEQNRAPYREPSTLHGNSLEPRT
jgi:hypothetical protein